MFEYAYRILILYHKNCRHSNVKIMYVKRSHRWHIHIQNKKKQTTKLVLLYSRVYEENFRVASRTRLNLLAPRPRTLFLSRCLIYIYTQSYAQTVYTVVGRVYTCSAWYRVVPACYRFTRHRRKLTSLFTRRRAITVSVLYISRYIRDDQFGL
jgi:hypothetical protein